MFDKSGNPITPDYTYSLNAPTDRNIFEFRDGYLDQLTYINHEILAAVDGILANSNNPPIIILQGDHGPEFF